MNILVTGGTSAVGRALIKCLAECGHHIVFTYCRHADLAQQLCHEHTTVETRRVDFTDPDSVVALTDEIAALEVDVLVNNAYVGQPMGTHFHRTALSDFAEAFNVNVLPVIRITQACISAMRRKKSGMIVTVGTLATHDMPPAGYSVYAATKAYLQQLARSWHSEYSHLGIRSMTVQPDFMPTPLHGDMVEHLAQQQLLRHDRLLTPAEVASAIVGAIDGNESFVQELVIETH